MNRPMVWVGFAFALGTFTASQRWCPGFILPIALQAAGIIGPLLVRRQAGFRSVSVVLCFFGLGALLWNVRAPIQPGDAVSRYTIDHPGDPVTLEGRIRSANIMLKGATYTSFELAVDQVRTDEELLPLRGAVLVRWSKPARVLFADEYVRVTGVAEQNIGHVNPDILSPEDHYRNRGIHSIVRVKDAGAVTTLAPGRRTSLRYWASRFRDYQAQRLSDCLPKDIQPFVFAVWLGDRTGMAGDEYQSYIESGTAHILSVSGIHMAIVFLTFAYLARMYLRNRRLRSILALGIVVMFTVMSGARLATVRSAIMIAAYLLYDLFEREPDTKTALSWSGLLVLLADPRSLYDTGFQLSFLSVASILLYSDAIGNAFQAAPRVVRSAFGVSLAAQVLPLPLALRTFHLIPLLAPVANLFIVPLLSGVLWLVFGTTFAALFSTDLGLILGHALIPLVYAIRLIAKVTANSVLLPSPTLLAMGLYWGTVLWLGTTVPDKGMWPTRLGVALLLLTAVTLCWQPFVVEPRVVFLDVGHGDAAFVQTPGGTTLLVDGGNRKDQDNVDYGAAVVAPFLWANHLTRLDYVVATHADNDHIGGLRYVLTHFRVGAMVMGPIPSNERNEEELLEVCRRRSVLVRRVQRGDVIPVKGASVETLHPPADWPGAGSNNNLSVALRLKWPGLTALFTGDIEKEAEASLDPERFQSDVVKVPHHGSRSSSSPAFVRSARPRHAIFSTGAFSGRPLADPAILRRYEDAGAAIWRTDFDGGITVTVKQGVLRVEGAREQRGYLARADAPAP